MTTSLNFRPTTFHPARRAGLTGLLLLAGLCPQIDAATLFGTTSTGDLVRFDSSNPGAVTTLPLMGLAMGERLRGIDFRPANNRLYGISNNNQLYIVNTSTGGVAPVGTGFTPGFTGDRLGVDFNPRVDLLRAVSHDNENRRIDPVTGTVRQTPAPDSDLKYDANDRNANQDPTIVGSAYDNNVAGTPATTLFGLDSQLFTLVRQGGAGGANPSPNGGLLFTIADFTVNGVVTPFTSNVGFDVNRNGIAYAAIQHTVDGFSDLYTIDLVTGAGTRIGAIGDDLVITGLSSSPVPEPATTALVGAGLAAVIIWQRRRA